MVCSRGGHFFHLDLAGAAGASKQMRKPILQLPRLRHKGCSLSYGGYSKLSTQAEHACQLEQACAVTASSSGCCTQNPRNRNNVR